MLTLMTERPLPEFIRRWPRWARVACVWIAAMCTPIVVVLIAAWIGLVGGLFDCGSEVRSDLPWVCSSHGRPLFALLIIALALPPAMIWSRFLRRIAAYRTDARQESADSRPPARIERIAAQKWEIPFAQTIVSGTVSTGSGDAHNVRIEREELTFVSVNPVNKGWLKDGDQAYVAYQRIPGVGNLRIALAFSPAGFADVRGVAVRGQAVLTAIWAVAVIWLGLSRVQASPLLFGLLILFLCEGVLYLLLASRARSALRDFIRNAPVR